VTDVHNVEQRSRNMAAIRGKDTKPEIQIRHGLFSRGYRYRLHCSGLAGKPDLVFPKYRAAIQVQGCFWHKHDCRYFKWPATRPEFWRQKIEGNVARDQRALYQLKIDGWRALVIWECALKKCSPSEFEELLDQVERWLLSQSEYHELPSATPSH
jgi:DNA mismatch endonuclease, patch repair protein